MTKATWTSPRLEVLGAIAKLTQFDQGPMPTSNVLTTVADPTGS